MQIEKTIHHMNETMLKKSMKEIYALLTAEQRLRADEIMLQCKKENENEAATGIKRKKKMSQSFVDEKMKYAKSFFDKIEEQEYYLEADGYEDYSMGYWSDNWVWEYYDEMQLCKKIEEILSFTNDFIHDGWYEEALEVYDMLLDMEILVNNEWDEFTVGLEELKKENLLYVDLKQVALQVLYADYQVREPEKRAEDIFSYFSYPLFLDIHVEEMFRIGRETLPDENEFWEAWIKVLLGKNSEIATRLLKEAIGYSLSLEDMVEISKENIKIHPSISFFVMQELSQNHKYGLMEDLGLEALRNIDEKYMIRSSIAYQTAFAAEQLSHGEIVKKCCFETYCSDTNVKNYLRICADNEIAKEYLKDTSGKLKLLKKSDVYSGNGNSEFQENLKCKQEYLSMRFFLGMFDEVKNSSKNPDGSLGWSGEFIGTGVKLFLLLLADYELPTKALRSLSDVLAMNMRVDMEYELEFEKELKKESDKLGVSVFWNLFQRWKNRQEVKEEKKEEYKEWLHKIIYSRTDAIVGGQHRNQYGDVALLLGALGDMEISCGNREAKNRIKDDYKKKFPRHSSFWAEMKKYFN